MILFYKQVLQVNIYLVETLVFLFQEKLAP